MLHLHAVIDKEQPIAQTSVKAVFLFTQHFCFDKYQYIYSWIHYQNSQGIQVDNEKRKRNMTNLNQGQYFSLHSVKIPTGRPYPKSLITELGHNWQLPLIRIALVEGIRYTKIWHWQAINILSPTTNWECHPQGESCNLNRGMPPSLSKWGSVTGSVHYAPTIHQIRFKKYNL